MSRKPGAESPSLEIRSNSPDSEALDGALGADSIDAISEKVRQTLNDIWTERQERLQNDFHASKQKHTTAFNREEELLAAKDENRKLKLYIEQILREIEDKAPVLKRKRVDYERAVDAINVLTKLLEEARQEYEFRKTEAEDARKRMATMTRENIRFRGQIDDMSRQVAVLLNEIEILKSGSGLRESGLIYAYNNQQSAANQPLDEKLLTFRDLEELHKRNIELISTVRELSYENEIAGTRSVDGDKIANLNAIAAEVPELRKARQRQETVGESILHERDMYKNVSLKAKGVEGAIHKAVTDSASASGIKTSSEMTTAIKGAGNQNRLRRAPIVWDSPSSSPVREVGSIRIRSSAALARGKGSKSRKLRGGKRAFKTSTLRT